MQKTPCCIKKFAVTEVDPCGGVEKHPTGVWYEIDKYVLSMRRGGGVPVSSSSIRDTQDIK